MTLTPLERAARALDEALAAQIRNSVNMPYVGKLDEIDMSVRVDGEIELLPLVRAVLQAIREPDGEVLQAGNRVWLDGGNERQIFEAMLDAILGPLKPGLS